jgi:5-methylcytosine-specific restriction endonuclease McrA
MTEADLKVPPFWIDHYGRTWKTPTILRRLKFKIPCHFALRQFVIFRDKVCQHCGTSEDLVADHIVSRRNGGTHHPSNMQALCQSCNSRKANRVDAKGVS